MSDIFISYARGDGAKAKLLAETLAQQGWSVWWDRNIPPGKSFDAVIEEALDSARCVVVLWSTESASSDWVKTEAAEGAKRGILVPALIENVKIPLEFRRIQAANLSDSEGTSSHPELIEFLKAVSQILGSVTTVAIEKADQVLFKCKAYKRWAFSVHLKCQFIVRSTGIEFIDNDDPSYSFAIPAERLEGATFTKPTGFLGIENDLLLILQDGSEYEVGFDDGDKERALKAVHISSKTDSTGAPKGAFSKVWTASYDAQQVEQPRKKPWLALSKEWTASYHGNQIRVTYWWTSVETEKVLYINGTCVDKDKWPLRCTVQDQDGSDHVVEVEFGGRLGTKAKISVDGVQIGGDSF